jgi:putative flavoprotein involved in K+ transport
MPRRYRGRDIWFWLDAIGNLDESIDEVPSPREARRAPSLAITGANGGEELNLGRLSDLGVAVCGRLRGFDGQRAIFVNDLELHVASSDERLRHLLARIDEHIADALGPHAPQPEPVPQLSLPACPGTADLRAEGVATVIWATGYRRSYPWLRVPVFDEDGEIVQRRGVTPVDGVFVLGLRFQHRRKSHFIGGVGEDAAFLAELLAGGLAARRAA